jgi:hypothetical protein
MRHKEMKTAAGYNSRQMEPCLMERRVLPMLFLTASIGWNGSKNESVCSGSKRSHFDISMFNKHMGPACLNAH